MCKPITLFLFLYIGIGYGQPQELILDPPGTLEIDSKFYIDRTPVTNKMFLEYLTAKHFLRKKGFSEFRDYEVTLDDTLTRLTSVYPSYLLNLKGVYGKDLKAEYVEDSKYKDNPVLGVSKEQAADYCKWRTQMVSYLWRTHPGHLQKKPFAGRINYRLPLPEELQQATDYFSEQNRLLTIKGKNPLKFKAPENDKDFYLYNISEYTQASRTYGENYKGIKPISFPNEFTGFRCVCEVLPEEE